MVSDNESEKECLLELQKQNQSVGNKKLPWADFNPQTEYSPSDVITEIGFGKYQIIWLFIVGCSFLGGAAMVQLQAVWSSRLYVELQLTPTQESILSAVSFTGLTFSPVIFGWLCDRIGRKNSMVLANALLLFWNLMTCVWENYTWILFMRFFVSLSRGKDQFQLISL